MVQEPVNAAGLLSSGRYIIFTRLSEPQAARGRDADDDQPAGLQSTGASPETTGHGHQGDLFLSPPAPGGGLQPRKGGLPPEGGVVGQGDPHARRQPGGLRRGWIRARGGGSRALRIRRLSQSTGSERACLPASYRGRVAQGPARGDRPRSRDAPREGRSQEDTGREAPGRDFGRRVRSRGGPQVGAHRERRVSAGGKASTRQRGGV